MQREIYLSAWMGVMIVIMSLSCHPVKISPMQQGDWIQSAEIGNYPRGNAVSFIIGDKAYVGTGFNENVQGTRNRLRDFWSFSVDSGWTQVQDFPGAPRSSASAFGLGNYGYVGTGWDGVNSYNDFYQYDPVANKWNPKSNFPGTVRYDAIGFAVQGKGYIGTGFGDFWLNDFYQYDPQNDNWVRTIGTSGDFSKRRGAVAFVYHDKAYIGTGSTSASMTKDFWSFDPSQAQPWTRLKDIINDNSAAYDDGYTDIQRELAVAFVKGDSAYLTLGQNGAVLNSTWVYDFAHDQWSPRSPYHRQARFGAIAFTVKGRSFVGTGNSGSGTTFDDFDEWLPYQVFNSND
jgi:N-acetylneuraminic acid mutarotase